MGGWPLRLAARALACAVVFFAVQAWLQSVPLAMLFTAPALAVAFAYPLIEAAAGASRLIHRHLWRDVAGRHHAFQGQAVDVLADEDGHAWLALAGLRRILPGLPPDEHLAHLAGAGRWQQAARGQPARLRADALAELLQRATDPRTLKFRHWLAREVVFPAQRRAARAG